ncbi:MAG: DUF5696 domain-containing protein [Fervidobacterium sp.]
MLGILDKKTFIGALLVIAVNVLLFSQGIGNEFLSNRFSKPDRPVIVTSHFLLDGYTKIAESEYLALYVNLESSSIRVLDKKNGYIWGDVIENTQAYNEMNDTWKSIAKSLVMIEYFDERGISNVMGSADQQVMRWFSKGQKGFTYKFYFKPIDITLSVSVTLKNETLIYSLKEESIKETGKFTLASVVFSPFFGSVVADEIYGYIFIPDGPGALIRFSKPAHYLNWFEKRTYGKDYSIENLASVNDLRSRRPNDFLRDEPTVLTPVFGISHGIKNNAIFGVVTAGKEYSSIIAYPSGILSQYNWASAKFVYRQKYLQPTSRSGAGIQVAQKDMNKFDAQLEINFLQGNDADYVGMAKYYKRNYLKGLQRNVEIESNTPIVITIIASDIEKKVIGYGNIAITTYEQMKEIITELKNSGVKNAKIMLEGWQSGGMHGNKIDKIRFEKKVGGEKALLEFIQYARKFGYDVFLVDNVTKVTEKQVNLKKEVGTNLSQSIIYEDRDNKDLWLYRSYYTNIKLSSKYLEQKIKSLNSKGINNVAIREYATKLYGDLKYNSEFVRSEALELVKNVLKSISQDNKLYLYTPNDYAWQYTKGFLEIPMNNSQYLFESDTVPFLQIVLSGIIDYYVPYVNNSFFSRSDILKSIEYGALPSFILTWLDNYRLKKTPLWDYPSTKFNDWKRKIIDVYNEVNSALKDIRGYAIVDRIVLEPGVVRVTYENDVSIVVNYTDESYKIDNYIVKPKSWLVIKSKRDSNGAGEI